MNTSQRTFPTTEEVAVIERRAQAMRAQVTAQIFKGLGAWITRMVRGAAGSTGHASKA